MDRKRQFRNVAFGGSWSEQIPGREELVDALDTLRRAAEDAASYDPRQSRRVRAALLFACQRHPKGPLLARTWNMAAAISEPRVRVIELGRIAALLAAAHGDIEPLMPRPLE